MRPNSHWCHQGSGPKSPETTKTSINHGRSAAKIPLLYGIRVHGVHNERSHSAKSSEHENMKNGTVPVAPPARKKSFLHWFAHLNSMIYRRDRTVGREYSHGSVACQRRLQQKPTSTHTISVRSKDGPTPSQFIGLVRTFRAVSLSKYRFLLGFPCLISSSHDALSMCGLSCQIDSFLSSRSQRLPGPDKYQEPSVFGPDRRDIPAHHIASLAKAIFRYISSPPEIQLRTSRDNAGSCMLWV